jgi:hypothetical protein
MPSRAVLSAGRTARRDALFAEGLGPIAARPTGSGQLGTATTCVARLPLAA